EPLPLAVELSGMANAPTPLCVRRLRHENAVRSVLSAYTSERAALMSGSTRLVATLWKETTAESSENAAKLQLPLAAAPPLVRLTTRVPSLHTRVSRMKTWSNPPVLKQKKSPQSTSLALFRKET